MKMRELLAWCCFALASLGLACGLVAVASFGGFVDLVVGLGVLVAVCLCFALFPWLLLLCSLVAWHLPLV